MRLARLIPLVVAALAFAVPVRAQQDVRDAKDHPMFPRLPGYFIVDYEASDSGSYEFDVNKDEPKRVDGRFTHVSYKIKNGANKAAPQQIGRTCTDLVVKRGGTRIWERFDADRGSTTAMLAPAEAGDKARGTMYVQIDVTGGGQIYDLYVVEESPAKPKAGPTAAQIADALNTKGRAGVPGLVFDAGKGSIKPDSMPALAVIAGVLKSDPSLKLEIQAHADNLTTAQARANVVKALLVTNHGIADARLTTAGIRGARPAADGVELVKK